MKTFAFIALIGAAQSMRFINNYDELMEYDPSGVDVQSIVQKTGIPEDDLQPNRHWAKPWP